MNWSLTESGNTLTPGNFLIGSVYDPSAPTVVVQSVVLPGPYTSPINFSFTGLNPQIYLFILWENTTATVGGLSRSQFSLQPTQNTVQVRADLYLTAGISTNFTVSASTYVADTPNDLTGWQYDLERVGQGTLQPGIDWQADTDGFHLLASGDAFGPGEKFVLHFLPQTSAIAPPPVTTGIVVVPQIITAPLTLDNTFTGKTGLIQGATSNLLITLPTLSSMAINKVIGFVSAGGSHISAILQCALTDTILWANGAPGIVTQRVLMQNEQIQLFKSVNALGAFLWNVLSVSDSLRMTGEIIYEYTTAKLNTTLADGGERGWNDNIRLRQYVQNLPGSQVVSEAAWNHTVTIDGVIYFDNKGKYTLGDNSTFFRVPLLFSYGFLRAIDPGSSRSPGDFQPMQILTHKHDTLIGSFPGTPNGKGGTRNNGRYNGQATNPSDLTSLPTNDPGSSGTGTLLTRVGTEIRPDNTGVFALIRQ